MTHGINTVQRNLKGKKKRQFNNFKTIYSFQKKVKGGLYSHGFNFCILKYRCCQYTVSLKVSLLRLAGGSFWIIFMEYTLGWREKKKRNKSKFLEEPRTMSKAPRHLQSGNKSQWMGDVTAISVTANISLTYIIIEHNFYVFILGGMLFY